MKENTKSENVKWKALGEIGEIYGGITGKKKEDFKNGNKKLITYKNVYENLSLNLNFEDKVRIEENEKQRKLKYGDIIFTGSSENLKECGLSSVVTEIPNEELYLNSFCFFLRLNSNNLLLPNFSKHLFRSEILRKKIIKTASGVTRFNVSKELMKKIQIPLPPLKKQEEIAAALDKFTELTEELIVREAQYDYYRNMLLIDQWNDKNIKLENAEIIRTTVGDIIERCSEKAKNDKNVTTVYTVSSEFGLIPSIDYWKRKGSKNKKSYKMFSDDTSNYNIVRKNMFAYNPARLNIGSISCLLNEKTGLLSPMYNVFKIKENIILPKYLLYFLKTSTVINKIDLMKESGARNRFDFEKWKKIEISIPAIEVQKKIVEFLDSFETLVNDIRQGLPREIELRKKQYEYYREKLLTF